MRSMATIPRMTQGRLLRLCEETLSTKLRPLYRPITLLALLKNIVILDATVKECQALTLRPEQVPVRANLTQAGRFTH